MKRFKTITIIAVVALLITVAVAAVIAYELIYDTELLVAYIARFMSGLRL